MPSRSRHARSARSSLLLAITVALLACGEAARGESISAPGFDAEAHARDCKCALHCRGQSCCCGRRPSASRRPAPAPTSAPLPSHRPTGREAGPCLGEAPCGDPGLPASTPAGPGARAAAILGSLPLRPTTASALLPSPDSRDHVSGRPTRIDRPPRA